MKTLVVMAAFLAALVVVAACKDPGKAGGTQHVAVRISDGTVLGKSNYGLWHADEAPAGCRWTVTLDGNIVASGGPNDAVISGTGLKGGVLHATRCGWFYK
jgi:hypothetical protein